MFVLNKNLCKVKKTISILFLFSFVVRCSISNNEKVNIATIRETFFFNQLSEGSTVTYPKVGDFKVSGK